MEIKLNTKTYFATKEYFEQINASFNEELIAHLGWILGIENKLGFINANKITDVQEFVMENINLFITIYDFIKKDLLLKETKKIINFPDINSDSFLESIESLIESRIVQTLLSHVNLSSKEIFNNALNDSSQKILPIIQPEAVKKSEIIEFK